jgi:hypothetical protein
MISIVIPCYNDAAYIKQSVNSALSQTYPEIEIILVDDGSNLNTKAVLHDIEPSISKLITQENQGQSAARNRGIEAAKGEFILVQDSDDFFEPSFCELAIAHLISDQNSKLVTCHAQLLYANGTVETFKPKGGNINDFLFSNAALGSLMFRKKDWLKAGKYDEQMRHGWEDWEFYIRLLHGSGKCYVINETLFNYRKKEFSTTTIANAKQYELLKYILKKHQNSYVNHYDALIDYLILRCEGERRERQKNLKHFDYKLGAKILKPLRWVKNSFK